MVCLAHPAGNVRGGSPPPIRPKRNARRALVAAPGDALDHLAAPDLSRVRAGAGPARPPAPATTLAVEHDRLAARHPPAPLSRCPALPDVRRAEDAADGSTQG